MFCRNMTLYNQKNPCLSLFLLFLLLIQFSSAAQEAQSLHYARADVTNNLNDNTKCPGWTDKIQWAVQTGGGCGSGGSFTALNCINDQNKKISPGETVRGECQFGEVPPGDLSAYCLRITWCGRTGNLSGAKQDEHLRSETGGPTAVAEAGDYWNRFGDKQYYTEDLWIKDYNSYLVDVDFIGYHSSSPAGGALTCEWEFKGGIVTSENCASLRACSSAGAVKQTLPCAGPGNNIIFGRKYFSNGDYPVILTVKDGNGLSDTDTVVVHISSFSEDDDPENTCKKLGGSCYCPEGSACGSENLVSGSVDCPESCYKPVEKKPCTDLGGSCQCAEGKGCLSENKLSGSSDCADSCCRCTDKPVVASPCQSLGGSCSCPDGQECLSENKVLGSSDCVDSCCKCTDKQVVASPCQSLGGSCSCPDGQECLSENKVSGSSDCLDSCCKCTDKQVVASPCQSLGGSCSCPDGQECLSENKVSGSSDCLDSCCKCTAKPVDESKPFASLYAGKPGEAKAESVSVKVGEAVEFDPSKSVLPEGYVLDSWVIRYTLKKDGKWTDNDHSSPVFSEPFKDTSFSYTETGLFTARLEIYLIKPPEQGTDRFDAFVSVDVVADSSEVPPGEQNCASLGGSCGCPSEKECKTENKIPGSSDCADACCKCTDKPVVALTCQSLGGSCACPDGEECLPENKVSGSSDCADGCCKCTLKEDGGASTCQSLGGSCSCPTGQECRTENYVTGSSDCEGACCKCTEINYKFRVLFVPMDWSGDMTAPAEQEKFVASLNTLKTSMAAKIPLASCPDKLRMDYSFSVCSAGFPSDSQTLLTEQDQANLQNRPSKYDQALDACKQALDASLVNGADNIVYVSDKNLAGNIGGQSTKNSNVIWVDEFYDSKAGDVILHELGHTWGLADEYFDGCACSGFNPCHNPLSAAYYGGDPYGASGMQMYSPYCQTTGQSQCPPENSPVVCEGNQNSKKGRCIMSSYVLTEFCPLCVQRLNSLDILKCT
jgi:hypothetical protein